MRRLLCLVVMWLVLGVVPAYAQYVSVPFWCMPAMGSVSSWGSGTAFPVNVNKHSASVLQDGRILVVGGEVSSTASVSIVSATYIGSVSGTAISWVSSTSLPVSRIEHGQHTLSDGRVVILGGNEGLDSSNVYFGTVNMTSITWVSGTSLPQALSSYQGTILGDGRIIIAGGATTSGLTISTTYLGTISTNSITWVTSTELPRTVADGKMDVLKDGRVVVVNGESPAHTAISSVYIGSITNNSITWVASTSTTSAEREHMAHVLPDGQIFSFGGYAATTRRLLGTVSGTTISWTTTTAMPSNRYEMASVVLPDGRVVSIAGKQSVPVHTSNTYIANWSGIRC
jgi:hypothetical protein